MGTREQRSLHNHMVRLIEHLLKWQYQPERRGSSWTGTIILQRRRIRRQLDENPSFRPSLPQVIAEAYDDAAAVVAGVTNWPRNTPAAVVPL